MPAHVLGEAEDWRAPIAPALRSAEAVARLGGRPADGDSVAEHEDAVLALVHPDGDAAGAAGRPHDDPQPARRIARRILQRLNGMGKWGGYHTDFRHLARGFAGNERALADEVGEALIAAGLLDEKPSVGQRHVFLNPRRAADIHALIDRGDAAAGSAAAVGYGAAVLLRHPVNQGVHRAPARRERHVRADAPGPPRARRQGAAGVGTDDRRRLRGRRRSATPTPRRSSTSTAR